MKQFLLFIFLIPFAVISYGGVSNVVVSGHVFDEITGQAVPNHIVTVKFRNIDPPVVYFEKVSTGQSGFYSHVLSLPVSNGIIEVSTIDCYHQILSQSLPFNVYNNNLIADFTICYVPQLTYCHSDFIFVPDPEENNHILFKETSLGDIDSWYWDFGDGDISYEPDPTHLYIEDGIYEVCLTITGNSGSCDDQFCALVSYVGDSICQANFISFPVSGLANTIQFLDLSVGAIHTWYWDFGDGEDSDLQSPTHTYTEPGLYEVCLTVEDTSISCTDTYCSSVQVGGNFECQSNYNYFYDPGNPMGVQFYDNAIGYPTDWYWEFGDGSTSVNQNPFHVYSNEGIYNVCLTISSDITGCIDTYCDMIMVYIEAPCDAYFEYIETSVDPHTYQFVDLSVGEIENWEWDFGDNTTSTLQNPLHSYYDPGEYTICLTVSDEEGNCYDAYCETIFAGVTPQCTAFYTYVQDTTNYMTFQFVDLSIGNIASWEWDFGDGSFSGEQSPVHTYTSEDLYFICLTIVNETGICEDVFCQEIMVTNQVPCQADFDYFILPADPLSVQFMDLSGGSIDLWFWDFGDGDFSFDQSPLHTYDEDGEYLVCLNVMDFLTGCADQFCRMVEVSHIPTCEADFTYISSMNDPLSFQFVDLSSGNIAEWLWDFGDGTTSLTQNPDHIFTDEGTYEVCLSITDMWGICQDVHCEFIEIVLPDLCEADFDNTSIPDQLLAVQFIDQSEGIMTQWQWDFGDGSTSMLQNPVHIFPDSGYYSVQLSIVNPDSIVYCESAIVKNIHVFETAPNCQANFIAFPDSGINRPNLFHFSDLSTGSPTSWSWDFDDGTNSTEQNPVHQYDDFGSWEVKLIILTENQWGDDCEDEMSLTINSPEYFHIGGLLYAGDFPINNPEHTGDTAEICIYRQKNNVLTPLDTGRFVELGYFYFLHLLASDYLIKVNLTGGSSTHRVFFPTYLGEHLTWQQAAILHIADSSYYNLDINLNKIPDSENGIGLINGSVIHNPRKNVPPFPAGNTEILLFNNDNIPVNYAYSNQNGIFQFDNLPMGTYKVIAESTGMYSEPVFITLTESNPAAYDVKIEIFEDDLTSISEHPNKFDGMFVYPNPFREILNVDFAPGFPQDIIVRFFDITGKEIEIDEQNISVGSGKLKIDLGYFPRGLYLLKLYSEEGMILQAEKVFKL